MNFGPSEVSCQCGWSETYTPPLVMDKPRMGIDGSSDRPYVNCRDSAGKLIRHAHPAKP